MQTGLNWEMSFWKPLIVNIQSILTILQIKSPFPEMKIITPFCITLCYYNSYSMKIKTYNNLWFNIFWTCIEAEKDIIYQMIETIKSDINETYFFLFPLLIVCIWFLRLRFSSAILAN